MKKFKRILSLVLALLMVFALVACGGDPAASGSGSGEAQKPVQKTRVALGTAGSSGAYFIIGSALANATNEQSDLVEMTAEVTDGSAQNMTFLGSGDIQFGMASIATAYEAYTGTGKFEGKKVEGIMAIGNLHASSFQVVVVPDSGIKTIEDMKGKKIAIGAPGSGTRLNNNSILAACGISDADLQAFDLNIGESISAMKDRNLDGSFIQNAVPTSNLIDLATTGDMDLISFTDEQIDAILAANPLWTKTTIPASVYKLDHDTQTLGISNVMLCREDVSEEVAYEVTKMIYENLDKLTAAHDSMSLVTPESGPLDAIPLHPGAERYYREKGLIK